MPVLAGQFRGTVQVPLLISKTSIEAEALLKEQGLNFRWNEEGKYSSVVPKGSVLLQMPIPGREVKKGRTIALTVSKGLRELSIPPLRGKSLRQARISLNRMGLTLGKEIQGAHQSIPKDVVIRTEPPSGTIVRVGDLVDIVVSSGAKAGKTALPNVTGVSMEQAQMILDSAGFSIGTIERVKSEDKLPNTVISQQPLAAEYLETDTPINLKLSE